MANFTQDDLESFFQVLGWDLFEFEEAWAGKLDAQFNAWVEENHPDIYEEQPNDVWQLECLLKDENEPGVIADFVNALAPADRNRAIDGMLGLIERARSEGEDDDQSELDALRNSITAKR